MPHFSHEGCIEGCRQRDTLRKGSSSGADQSVQGLIERNDGNAQPRLLQEILLHPVDLLGDGLCPFRRVVLQHLSGCAARLPGSTHLKSKDPVAIFFLLPRLHFAGDHEQLPEFLLRCHALQKILHAGGDGLCGILVQRRLGLKRKAADQRKDGNDDSFHADAFWRPNVRSGSQGMTGRMTWKKKGRRDR